MLAMVDPEGVLKSPKRENQVSTFVGGGMGEAVGNDDDDDDG